MGVMALIQAVEGKWGKGSVSVSESGIEFFSKNIKIPFSLIENIHNLNSLQKRNAGSVAGLGGSGAAVGAMLGGPLGAIAGAALGGLSADKKNITVLDFFSSGVIL